MASPSLTLILTFSPEVYPVITSVLSIQSFAVVIYICIYGNTGLETGFLVLEVRVLGSFWVSMVFKRVNGTVLFVLLKNIYLWLRWSLLLCMGFLWLLWVGATRHCGTWASHFGVFSCCRAVYRHVGFSSCGTWALGRRLSSCGAWMLGLRLSSVAHGL